MICEVVNTLTLTKWHHHHFSFYTFNSDGDTLRTFAENWDIWVSFWRFIRWSPPCLLPSSSLWPPLHPGDFTSVHNCPISPGLLLILIQSVLSPRVPSLCQFLSPLTLIFCFFLHILLSSCRFPVLSLSFVIVSCFSCYHSLSLSLRKRSHVSFHMWYLHKFKIFLIVWTTETLIAQWCRLRWTWHSSLVMK